MTRTTLPVSGQARGEGQLQRATRRVASEVGACVATEEGSARYSASFAALTRGVGRSMA